MLSRSDDASRTSGTKLGSYGQQQCENTDPVSHNGVGTSLFITSVGVMLTLIGSLDCEQTTQKISQLNPAQNGERCRGRLCRCRCLHLRLVRLRHNYHLSRRLKSRTGSSEGVVLCRCRCLHLDQVKLRHNYH